MRPADLKARLRRLRAAGGGRPAARADALEAAASGRQVRRLGDRAAAAAVSAAPAVLGFATVGGLALSRGGYFPTTWGWAALALFSVAAVVLVGAPTASLGRLELLFLGSLTAFAGWIAVSLAWSGTPNTVLEVERTLVYVAAVLAVLLVVRPQSVPRLLAGVLLAVVVASGYGLATRLLPDRLGIVDLTAGSRLAEPLGYWNALGIFAAMGTLLALGFAARARGPALRALAATAPVLLVPTLYFTFGRGPWIAFAIGLAVAIAVDPRRLQLITVLLLLTPGPGLAVWLASRSELTRNQVELSPAAVHDGQQLTIAIVVLAAATAAAMLVLAYAERRIRLGRIVHRAYGLALLLALAAALGSVFVRYGGPTTIARDAYEAFKAPVGIVEPGASLNERLFDLSGNGRYLLWQVALRDRDDNPVLGSGAGTFERYWLRHRPHPGQARDAHSLYLETLAELGPPGLAVLALALVVPLAAGLRVRRHPLVPAAFSAYAAFLVHAGADWDWEVTAVTSAALFCAASLLIAARPESSAPLLPALRAAVLALTLALGAFAYIGLRSHLALAESESMRGIAPTRSAAKAREAAQWAPWSTRAKQLLARAQLDLGDAPAARATLSRAIAKDGGDWELWAELAVASEGRARRRALARATELNPLDSGLAEYRASLRGR